MKRLMIALGLALALAGCGDGKGSVSGTVTLDGKPVADGAVTFVKTEGEQVREGAVIKAGAFVAKMPPGKYRIELTGKKSAGTRVQKGFDGKDETIEMTEELFPERYNVKSELIRDIPAGGSTLELKLESKKN
jgi:hypothetical protein